MNRVEQRSLATGGSRAVSGAGASALAGAIRRFAGTTSGPVFIVLVVVFIGCLIAVTIDEGGTGNFLSVDNIREMLVRSVALGIVAAGQTLVIIGASLDLSVGWVMGLADRGSVDRRGCAEGQGARLRPDRATGRGAWRVGPRPGCRVVG